MATASYLLCVTTALVCAVLLMRAYRRHRTSLLYWAACCFAGLSLTNALVIVDLLVVRDLDLHPLRLIVGVASVLLLLFGMVWEAE
jgi:uncharacterized membrane protein